MGSPDGKKIIVVGAGIVGAAIAYRLTTHGHRVTVIEADSPGGVASPYSFGWINSTYGFARPYFDLRTASMARWRQLGEEIPELPLTQAGCLYLAFDNDGTPLDLAAFADAHAGWGYEIEAIGANRVRDHAPRLREAREGAAFAAGDMALDAASAAQIFIRRAIANGAQLIAGVRAERICMAEGRVTGVETVLGVIDADETVLAAGAATPFLVADIAPWLELTTPPGVLVHTMPTERFLEPIVLLEDVHVRQDARGRLIAGADFGGRTGANSPQEVADAVMRDLRAAFTGLDDLKIEAVTVGARPTPADGAPIVGPLPGVEALTVAVMHSGVTLAAIVADAVAGALGEDGWIDEIAPFSPARFVPADASVAAHVDDVTIAKARTA
ncbi:MAG: FAD-dependent oxidoreductase [Pseudomonadota bacterium]